MPRPTFLSRIVPDPHGCWLWAGTIDRHGYGRWSSARAHRTAYELWVGPIPKGLTLDHLCAVKRCVNPDHLEPVTMAENSRRMAARTTVTGSALGDAKAAKTICPKGHPYEGDNLVQRPNEGRRCRVCDCDKAKRYQQKRKQVVW